MKIVLDEDLHRSLGARLRENGHEVFDIRDYGLRGKPDEAIFEFAQKQSAVLFSGDLGFANVIKFPLGHHHGIAISRFPNEMHTDTINTIILKLMEKISESDYTGNLVIFSPARLRIRRAMG